MVMSRQSSLTKSISQSPSRNALVTGRTITQSTPGKVPLSKKTPERVRRSDYKRQPTFQRKFTYNKIVQSINMHRAVSLKHDEQADGVGSVTYDVEQPRVITTQDEEDIVDEP